MATSTNLVILKDIVDKHQCQTLVWGEDEIEVDVQTANLLLKVYNNTTPENQTFMLGKLEQSAETFQVLTGMCWKMVR